MSQLVGKIFEGEYPPEVAVWCNEQGNCYIKEIDATEEGVRRFQIVEIPKPSLEDLKSIKLSELANEQSIAEQSAYVTSSLGFPIDANDVANRNLEGLLYTTAEGQTVYFCDRNNEMHPVTREQLETMRSEVIQNGQAIYAQKWDIRNKIESADSEDALNAIEIKFTYLDFSNKDSKEPQLAKVGIK